MTAGHPSCPSIWCSEEIGACRSNQSPSFDRRRLVCFLSVLAQHTGILHGKGVFAGPQECRCSAIGHCDLPWSYAGIWVTTD
jgi:hypothetical protein